MFSLHDSSFDPVCYVCWLGSGIPYTQGLQLQKKLQNLRAKDLFPDSLLMMEHDHVYTLGRRSPQDHILTDLESIEGLGIALVETDRGGLVTYHGPGQLIGYPIIDLKRFGVGPRAYVRMLEDSLITVLREFDINAERVDGLTGVWVGRAKIGAIGVKISGGVTTHGFSLNVNTDISYYDNIVPCGIRGVEITSMSALLEKPVDIEEVRNRIASNFVRSWGFISYELTGLEFQEVLSRADE